MQSVGIADPLCNSPFIICITFFLYSSASLRFHSFLRYGTAQRNRSVTCRLLVLSIVDLIFSFRTWHTRTLEETRFFSESPKQLDNPRAFFFSFFKLSDSFDLNGINAMLLNSNPRKSRICISYLSLNMHFRSLYLFKNSLNESK